MFDIKLQIFGDLHTNDTTEIDSGTDNPSAWRTEINSFMSAFSGLTESGEASNVPVVDSSGVLNVKALNVTTPDTTEHTQQISIDDLPTGSLDGNINNWEYEGLTLVNQATADDTDSESVTDNDVLYLDTSGQFNPTSGSDLSIALANGDVYFVYIKLQSDSSEIDEIKSGNGTTAIGATTTFTSGLEVYQQVTSGGTTASKIAVVASETGNLKIKSAIFVNQTALGITSYTEAQMLDLVRGGYFEGIGNVENPRLSTVGKNLFAGGLELGQYNVTTGAKAASTTKIRSVGFTRVLPSTTYTLKDFTATSTDVFILEYTQDETFISYLGAGGGTGTKTFTTSSNAAKITFYINIDTGADYLDLIQLTQASSITTYEAYKSSTAQAECELRGLTSTVRDKLYESGGKIYHQQTIAELPIATATAVNTTNLPLASATSRYVLLQDDGVLSYGVVDGSYTTTDAGDIQYELATPVTTDRTAELKASGLLQSFEDGTMYLENGYRKTHLASSTTVTLASALSEITSIKYELSGEIVELTTDDYTFTAGSTSITGLPTADVEYFVEGLLTFNISGSFTGDVPTDTGAVIVSNTKAINSLSKQVADQQDIIDLLVLMV